MDISDSRFEMEMGRIHGGNKTNRIGMLIIKLLTIKNGNTLE
jgi:hypothetical protein